MCIVIKLTLGEEELILKSVNYNTFLKPIEKCPIFFFLNLVIV